MGKSYGRPEQNGYHFDGLEQERRNSSALAMALRLSCTNPRFIDNSFVCTFLNENDYILIQIPLNYIPQSPMGNKSTLDKVMASAIKQQAII